MNPAEVFAKTKADVVRRCKERELITKLLGNKLYNWEFATQVEARKMAQDRPYHTNNTYAKV